MLLYEHKSDKNLLKQRTQGVVLYYLLSMLHNNNLNFNIDTNIRSIQPSINRVTHTVRLFVFSELVLWA